MYSIISERFRILSFEGRALKGTILSNGSSQWSYNPKLSKSSPISQKEKGS